MLYYALAFLVVGLIAGALNLFGVSAIAMQISWILFVIGIVLVVIHLVTGRRTRIEKPTTGYCGRLRREVVGEASRIKEKADGPKKHLTLFGPSEPFLLAFPFPPLQAPYPPEHTFS